MVTNKIATPQPQIFSSDPLEQIYARGTLDRDMSGLSFMFKNAEQDRRRANQDAYMEGVSEANRMSQALAQQEMAQEKLIETMKIAQKLTEIGVNASDMPGLDEVIRNNPAGTGDAAMKMILALKQSQINENNAKAAAAGQGGADKYDIETQMTPSGVAYTTYKGKGRDPSAIQAELQRRALADMQARGLKPNPNSPLGLPTANAADAAQARANQRYGNVAQ